MADTAKCANISDLFEQTAGGDEDWKDREHQGVGAMSSFRAVNSEPTEILGLTLVSVLQSSYGLYRQGLHPIQGINIKGCGWEKLPVSKKNRSTHILNFVMFFWTTHQCIFAVKPMRQIIFNSQKLKNYVSKGKLNIKSKLHIPVDSFIMKLLALNRKTTKIIYKNTSVWPAYQDNTDLIVCCLTQELLSLCSTEKLAIVKLI